MVTKIAVSSSHGCRVLWKITSAETSREKAGSYLNVQHFAERADTYLDRVAQTNLRSVFRSDRRHEVVLEHDAVFHDEYDFLDGVDVLNRIAVDRDDVGEFPGLDGSDAIGPV